MSGATDHLPRLLALVPWLLAHPGTPIADVAREFDVSEDQLRADLNLIWVCGLPGYGPGDLIDVVWEGDGVTLTNADTIARPLRLTPEEALALVAALRALSGVPGVVDTASVDRALAKIESAAGAAVAGDRVLSAPAEGDAVAADVATAVTDALARGRRLHLSYWVPARDETTERDVDPIRLFTSEGAAYLSGWCRRVEDLRTFRLDRVLTATVLDVPAEVPADARNRGLRAELFEPAPDDQLVSLSVQPPARWVSDYYPCESVTERPDGGLDITLRVRDPEWASRMALGLAGVGEVTRPQDLAARIRATAGAALDHYQ